MTTESRPNSEADLEENMRKVGETATGKINKDEKATASGEPSEAAGFSLPFGLGKKKKKEEAAPAPTPTPPPAAEAPAPTPPPAPAPPRTYTVKSGDTLWDIAVSYYGDGQQYRKIARANNIADPNLINIGVVLTIPE